MPKPLPPHPNVRNCTHIKVTGQRCGSPALRGEFFCYFHTRVIKGVQQRVDMRLDSIALLEDCESIQLSIMHVVDGLVKGTLETPRARLILEALRIAARNAKNVCFDTIHESEKQSMVRHVPDYAHQYLIEHPEFGPPLSQRGTGKASPSQCGAGAPAREAATNLVHPEAKAAPQTQTAPQAEPQNPPQKSMTTEPAAKRRQTPAHGASRGTRPENHSAPQERKNSDQELARVQAAIAGAERGN